MNSSTKRSIKRVNIRRQDILTAVIAGLQRTVVDPIALTLTTLACTYFLSVQLNDSKTPLVYLQAYVNRELSTKPNKFETFALTVLGYLLKYIVRYEAKFAIGAANFVPYSLRPTTPHLVLSVVLTLISTALPSVNVNIFLAAALAFWAYTQFDNPGNKIFALLVCALLIFVNIEIDVLDAVHKTHAGEFQPVRNAPSPPSGPKVGQSGPSAGHR